MGNCAGKKCCYCNIHLMVLVAVVVNAIAAIEDIRVHDKPINQMSVVKCIDLTPASSYKV